MRTALALLAGWVVFDRVQEDQFKFFYLLFLPSGLGGRTLGFVGAAWSAAIVQMLVIMAVQSSPINL